MIFREFTLALMLVFRFSSDYNFCCLIPHRDDSLPKNQIIGNLLSF